MEKFQWAHCELILQLEKQLSPSEFCWQDYGDVMCQENRNINVTSVDKLG